VTRPRRLDWDGCRNVRDLGWLPGVRWGAVVRGDSPDRLTDSGWAALRAHGIRTIVDLRNDDERDASRPAPEGIDLVHVPLDGVDDTAFWDFWGSGPQFGTPLYYRPHLNRFPERNARAVAAVARAAPGAVLVHCAGGRDRAGQVAMLLLALAGVPPDDIAADYVLSGTDPEIEKFLVDAGISVRELILATLASVDVEDCLRGGGLTDADLDALRARLAEAQG
jgi:protein tyrosine/serine phosphatase